MVWTFGVVSKSLHLALGPKDFSPEHFIVLHLNPWHFKSILYTVWHEVYVEIVYLFIYSFTYLLTWFAHGFPPLVEKAKFSLLNYFCLFVKNQLGMFTEVLFLVCSNDLCLSLHQHYSAWIIAVMVVSLITLLLYSFFSPK